MRESPTFPMNRRRSLGAAGGIFSGASAVLLLAYAAGTLPRQKPVGLDTLVQVAGSRRMTDGRLSGGFAHAPRTRAAHPSPALLESAASALAAGNGSNERETLHVRGVAQLLLGRLDEAIT